MRDVPPGKVLDENDVEVRALSKREWRVRNKRLSPQNAFGLLGFIELSGSTYTVLQLGRGTQRFEFATLEEAVAHLRRLPETRRMPSAPRV